MKCNIDICYNCKRYDIDCDGIKHYKKLVTEKGKTVCKNIVRSLENTDSPIQLQAFYSLYKTKIRYGMDRYLAFAEAIVQTSDDVFQKIDESLKREIQGFSNKGIG